MTMDDRWFPEWVIRSKINKFPLCDFMEKWNGDYSISEVVDDILKHGFELPDALDAMENFGFSESNREHVKDAYTCAAGR